MSLTLSLLLSTFLLISCLTLCFGSWLETNDLFYSTSAGQSMAIVKLLLRENSTNEFKALTFGLWRYCLWDTTSGSSICSPVNIKYNPDFSSIFHSLTQNQIADIYSSSKSYVRFVPLLMASILSITAFVISLFSPRFNAKKTIQQYAFLITIGFLSIINSVICSISFGSTFHSYFSNMKRLCASNLIMNDESMNIYSCHGYTVKDESILLAITIGIQVSTFIYTIFCFYQTRRFVTVRQKNEIISQPPPLFLDSTVHSEKANIFYKREDEKVSPESFSEATELWNEYPSENTYNTQLSLRPRPISNQLNYAGRRSKEITCHNNNQQLYSAFKTNSDQKNLNPATIRTNSSDITTNGSLDMYTSASSLSLGDNQLVPPKRPFVNENVYIGNNGIRPLSYGSDNTFGIIAANTTATARSDNSSQISSIGHGGSSSNISSSIIYSNNENPATQSNHTLGGGKFLAGHTSNIESYYSSVDEEDITDQEQVLDKDALMIPSNYTHELPKSETLSKRINQYLQPQK